MKAMCLDVSGEFPKLVEVSIPQPQPGPGEVLVRVAAAGVIRTELDWYPTTHLKSGEPRHNAVPSHEFSGTIEALGEGVRDFTVGQRIYGMNDWFADGALAEFCLTTPHAIAPGPATLSLAAAATVPISALTAWQGLFDRGRLQPGYRVLIHGAAGSVGLFAAQLAHLHGAQVTGIAAGQNTLFARQLGISRVIDYHTVNFDEVLKEPFDIVFDTVGADLLVRSLPLLKPGGVAITVSSSNEGSSDERVKNAFFIVEPNQRQLMEIAALIDTYKLRTWIKDAIPFERADEAYRQGSPTPGKVIVLVDPAA